VYVGHAKPTTTAGYVSSADGADERERARKDLAADASNPASNAADSPGTASDQP
jgi:hypothetical protein